MPLESPANKNGRRQAIEEEDYLQMTGREVKAKPVSSSTCSLSSGLPALRVCSSTFVCLRLPRFPRTLDIIHSSDNKSLLS